MPYREINIQTYLSNQITAGSISQEDGDLIHEFITERKATKGISDGTCLVTAKGLSKFIAMLPPLKECKTSDIFKALNAVGEMWKQNTRRLRIFYFKTFLLWLIDEGHNNILNLKKIEAIQPPKADKATKTAAQMIPENKIDEMIRSCRNVRDRAMLALAYEGALRPIEVREAKWSQLKFDEYGAVFTTAKKTGKPRYIRLLTYPQYLAVWKSDYHPGEPEADKLIFVTRAGGILSRQYFDNIISRAAQSAGLKNIFPYLLRHSRITAMTAQGIPESVVKLQAWGSLSTPMMATYTHLNNEQLDDVMLKSQGIKRGRPKGITVKPVQCAKCDSVNVPGARFCFTCGLSLTDEAENEEKDVRMFASNPEKLRRLADLLEKERPKPGKTE